MAAQALGLAQPPDHDRHGRAEAQRLLDDGVQVLVLLTGVDLLAQELELLGMAQQPLEGPGQRGRGRPVGEQRDQLVAQILLGQRRAVLIACAPEQRDDVVADLLGALRSGAAGPRPSPPRSTRPRARRKPRSLLIQRGPSTDSTARRRGSLSHAVSSSIDVRTSSRRSWPTSPKTIAHDHLERDRLHARPELERLADRPAGDLLLRNLAIMSA